MLNEYLKAVNLLTINEENRLNLNLEPEFPREYMGQYLGKVGNVFLPSQNTKLHRIM
jgi:hypothetical protein